MTKAVEIRHPIDDNLLQNEDEKLSRQSNEQGQLAAEKARREQAARESGLRAIQERMEQERAAAEKARQKQLADEIENRKRRNQEEVIRKQEKEREDQLARQIIEQKQLAAEKAHREQVARENRLRAIQEKMEQERAAAEKARQKQLAGEIENQKRRNQEEATRIQEKERDASDKAERNLSAITTPRNKPISHQAKKAPDAQGPVQQDVKPIPLSLPLIKGDLKLVIAGDKLPDTTIMFKEFAQSRRNKPFSRAESNRNIKQVPLIVNTAKNTREVIIAQAKPGVYTIIVEPAEGPTKVILSMKLHEDTMRSSKRHLGEITITQKKVISKILMPDGIFWDDNNAFSGNMEDSDGVTKFNSETGLMWKEYND